MTIRILHGDCIEVMKTLPDASVDSIVTDPPAGIGFMGKGWDSDKGGRDQWIAWMQSVADECLRVLKPGGHALVWALPRTSHWTATAWENAGFEVRDRVAHLHGAGFPKSLNVSKALDGVLGSQGRGFVAAGDDGRASEFKQDLSKRSDYGYKYEPATDAARQWQGWGTALKPAMEDWWLLRRPLAKGNTVAANVLAFGTGGLNIDACRVGIDPCERDALDNRSGAGFGTGNTVGAHQGRDEGLFKSHELGRWPANLILSYPEDEYALRDDLTPEQRKAAGGAERIDEKTFKAMAAAMQALFRKLPNPGSDEVLAVFPQTTSGTLTPEMNVKASTGWSGGSSENRVKSAFEANTGSAARFFKTCKPDASSVFYTAKASAYDRNDGTYDLRVGSKEGMNHSQRESHGEVRSMTFQGNHHPTVKPTELMRYLCRLITPPGGTVLDPFMGSGSTLKAAELEGFSAVGIEIDQAYVEIAKRRIGSDFSLFVEIE